MVDELADLGVLNLALSGGKILVHRDLFAIAAYARSKGFLLRLFTNGTLIKPANADRIAALHPFAVEISVYGAGAATHDAITQRPGSFAATLRALLLAARGVHTVWKTPLMNTNVRQFHTIQELAAEVGAQFRYDLTIPPKITGDRAPLRHRLTYADLVWHFRQILAPDDPFPYAMPSDCTTCNISATALVIDPYGDVFPCLETRLCAGNVRRTSLAALWEESPVWQELRRLTVNDLPACRTCTLRPFCTRCHGLALNEHGDLRAPAAVNCQQFGECIQARFVVAGRFVGHQQANSLQHLCLPVLKVGDYGSLYAVSTLRRVWSALPIDDAAPPLEAGTSLNASLCSSNASMHALLPATKHRWLETKCTHRRQPGRPVENRFHHCWLQPRELGWRNAGEAAGSGQLHPMIERVSQR